MKKESLYGGVEAGGTKFVCAVGCGPDDLLAEESFPTTTPEETLGRTVAFFRKHLSQLSSIGIGSFGPVDPDPTSSTYGFITTTPKPGWADTEFAGCLRRELELPVGFDTDVNAAAMGEHRWGAARGLDTFVYLTVGTGIGGGGLVAHRRMRGLIHPEMGHMRLPRADGDDFAGVCPFHGDCLEGMISGPALEARVGGPARDLPPQHPEWDFQVHYLAHAIVNITCVLSPQRIIVGGGVMHQVHLFPRLRGKVQELLNGYIQSDTILNHIDRYIMPPELGDRAGVLGTIALAQEAAGQAPATGTT